MAAVKWNIARQWARSKASVDRAYPDKESRVEAYNRMLSTLVNDMEILKRGRPARLHLLAECHQRMQFMFRMRANISRRSEKPLGLGWLRDLATDLIQGKVVG